MGSVAAKVEQPALAATAIALLLWAPVAAPAHQLSALFSCFLGTAAGAATFVLVSRRLLPWRASQVRVGPALALLAPRLLATAIAEEAVWRYAMIGALRPSAGLVGAGAASTVCFSLAHIRRGLPGVCVHMVTGLGFTLVYLATGHLAAAVSAHLAYNLLVVSLRIASSEPQAAHPA